MRPVHVYPGDTPSAAGGEGLWGGCQAQQQGHSEVCIEKAQDRNDVGIAEDQKWNADLPLRRQERGETGSAPGRFC